MAGHTTHPESEFLNPLVPSMNWRSDRNPQFVDIVLKDQRPIRNNLSGTPENALNAPLLVNLPDAPPPSTVRVPPFVFSQPNSLGRQRVQKRGRDSSEFKAGGTGERSFVLDPVPGIHKLFIRQIHFKIAERLAQKR